MFLDRLIVKKGSEEIRNIKFKVGLNLILDMTSNVENDSGNDVGKTTVLRIVDYCLGSNGTNIYLDPEFKTKNQKIFDFISSDDVRFILTLKSGRYTLTIERSFNSKPRLNGLELSDTDFNIALGKELLRLKSGKPTFRQVIGKFIRTEHYQIANTIKFLYPKATADEYDPVYLYLFGFEDHEVLASRKKLIQRCKKLEAQRAALKELSPESLKQVLFVLNHEIEKLEKKVAEFQVSDGVQAEINQLESLRSSISDSSLQVSTLRMRLRMSEQTVSNLEQAVANIDTNLVSQLYSEAKRELPQLNKKLDDVLEFHNKMISNKISFVRGSIKEVLKQIELKDADLQSLLAKEKEVLQEIARKGALSDYQKLNSELSDLYEQRGQKEAVVKKLEEIIKDLGELRKDLKVADEKLLSYQEELDKKLKAFNLIFSDYSKKLYGEEYILVYEPLEGKHGIRFDFKIANVRGNEGTGKKRAQVTALDLSYLQFLAKSDAKTIRFTLHDRVEEIDATQLKTLFEIANGIDGQYVVAVLRDKLQGIDDKWIEQNTVLHLSQKDKFFKLS